MSVCVDEAGDDDAVLKGDGDCVCGERWEGIDFSDGCDPGIDDEEVPVENDFATGVDCYDCTVSVEG